jgi:hypothetical protein
MTNTSIPLILIVLLTLDLANSCSYVSEAPFGKGPKKWNYINQADWVGINLFIFLGLGYPHCAGSY